MRTYGDLSEEEIQEAINDPDYQERVAEGMRRMEEAAKEMVRQVEVAQRRAKFRVIQGGRDAP